MNAHLIFGELIRAMARARTGAELEEIAQAMLNARLIITSIEEEDAQARQAQLGAMWASAGSQQSR